MTTAVVTRDVHRSKSGWHYGCRDIAQMKRIANRRNRHAVNAEVRRRGVDYDGPVNPVRLTGWDVV